MPTRPQVKVLTNTSVDVLNVIRNNASQNYRDYVPQATADAESIKEIGAIIMDYPALQNEFLSALVNRIGLVLITSKSYSNPWEMFKKGYLEFGETVEEIFVNLAKPNQFDQEVAEDEVFKREIPDVRSAFHIMNYQKFYKSTISNDQLRQAFLSWSGVTDLIARIVDAMVTSSNYDEFLVMKYMLAKNILNGRLYPQDIDAVTTANMKSIVADVKGVSNKLEFMNSAYNQAGVTTHTPKANQIVLVNSKFDAVMDVEVLASAFNMNKAEFMGQRVLVDGFGDLDIARLNKIFADDPTYTEISSSELAALNEIPCIVVDRDYFMIFDNLTQMTEQYNGQGLYWNYFYHVWKTFSVSPFANAIMFIPTTPGITTITVSPSETTLAAGASIDLTVNVTTTGFAPKTVTWTSSSENAVVDKSGKVTILDTAESEEEITITATSTFDTQKTGTATITVA